MNASLLLNRCHGFARIAIALILVMATACLGAFAQAPGWQTAMVVGGGVASTSRTSFSHVNAIATDASGNVYLTGYFDGTVSFGATTLINNSGGADIFIAKWNPVSGTFSWAQQAGGTGTLDAKAIAVNGTNVYVGGGFSGTVDIGSQSLMAAYGDAFVTKLIDAGTSSTFAWTQRVGGNDVDEATAIAVTGTTVYLAGTFSNAASFGSLSLISAGRKDAFLTKIIDAGATANFVWAQQAGGANNDDAKAIVIGGANIYVAGSFLSATANFGNAVALTNANATVPANAYYVAKLTDAGVSATWTWAQLTNGQGNAIGVNGSNIYVAGAAGNNVGVTKFTDSGPTSSLIWTQQGGGQVYDVAYGIAVDGASVYVAGVVSGAGTFGTSTIKGIGSTDAFVAKLTDAGSTGSWTWVQNAGGVGPDGANSVVVSGAMVYVAGFMESPTAAFGSIMLTIPPYGSSTSFLASFGRATGLATATPAILSAITIVPNPAHAVATVRLAPVAGATQVTLILLDAVGRTVRAQQVAVPAAGAMADLALAGLAPGLYHLRVQAGGWQISRTLVVE